ncbi:hypothetical protein VM1G_11203 [Cytospora mali]|uniref:Uncharacterized protein n=1 Tax=Cytospora mali TaxID=578113 RepID=A0A194VK82_CYTMA|nr:hypothetical protein VM1G_11203 [Valsa mali]
MAHIVFFLHLVWDFVESDFITFAVPNTAFGVLGAIASSGKITTNQTRRIMLFVIPGTLALNYALGPWRQGVFIMVLTWLYNDLGGGDELFLRELIIAVAYGLFNSGSLDVATGPGNSLSPIGVVWTSIISGIILTTMQVQDLRVIGNAAARL